MSINVPSIIWIIFGILAVMFLKDLITKIVFDWLRPKNGRKNNPGHTHPEFMQIKIELTEVKRDVKWLRNFHDKKA